MQRTLKNYRSVRNAALPVWVIPAWTGRIPIPRLYPKHSTQSGSCSTQRSRRGKPRHSPPTDDYRSKPKILLDNFWSGDLEETAARLRNRVGSFSRRAGMRRRSRFRRPLALKLQMLIETSPLKAAHPGGCNEMICHVNEVPRRGVNYFTPAAAPTLASQIDSGHFLLRVPQTT